MKLRHALIAIVAFVSIANLTYSNPSALPQEAPVAIRDARQFLFGFEPTITNYPMLLETVKAIVKKMVTGRGEGVLAAGKIPEKYRSRYMELLRGECKDCKIVELYDSHGELTYEVRYPDGFYIRASTDAGALEWQTKPATIPEIEANVERMQKDIWGHADEAGVFRYFEGTGGHVTESGFANDSFWYANVLKSRSTPMKTNLSWGFFGKDGYNATPVLLWDPKQQETYRQVHELHDRQWKTFLKRLEEGLDKASDAKVMKIYNTRRVMSVKDLSSKLFPIYHNPKLDQPRLGKRSKNKYVAEKPLNELIENRGVRPPTDASQPLKVAKFVEAENWHVKEMLNKGMEVKFTPNAFKPQKMTDAVRYSKKIAKDLGLDWKDYVEFSKVGDVDLVGNEGSINDVFVKNEYGAAKRDQLFTKLRNRFLTKKSLSAEEVVFLSDVMTEMSYTIPDAKKNAALFQQKITPEMMKALSSEQQNAVAKNFLRFQQRFPAVTDEIFAPLQSHLKEYVYASITQPELTEAAKVAHQVSKSDDLLKEMIRVHQSSPSATQLPLFADLVLRDKVKPAALEKYVQAVASKLKSGTLQELPLRFDEVADQLSKGTKNTVVNQTAEALANWWVDPKSKRALQNADQIPLVQWLAEASKNPEVLRPVRDYYSAQIKALGYGVGGPENLYKTTTLFDKLYQITPDHEKGELLASTLKEVKGRFPDQSPDRLIFVEKIEGLQNAGKVSPAGCSAQWGGWLKKMFRR